MPKVPSAPEQLFHELRTDLGKLIINRFNKTRDKHDIDFDPDTCYEAADDILICILAAALQLFQSEKLEELGLKEL